MISGFLRFLFTPPEFATGDEAAGLHARLVHHALLGNLGLIGVTVLVTFVGRSLPVEVGWAALALGAVTLFLVREVRKGRTRLAALLFLATAFLAITYIVADLGTIRCPATSYYVALIVAAAILFPRRGALALTALSALATGSLILAENAGHLPHPNYAVNGTQWVTTTALFATVGLWVYMATRTMQRTLAQAANEVAERRQVEAALRTSDARFRMIFEVSPLAMVLLDAQGNVEHLNQKFVRSFGYTRADVPTLAVWRTLAYPDPALRQRMEGAWQESLARIAAGETQFYQPGATVTCKDGTVRTVNFIVAPIGAARLAILEDVTERSRLMEELALRDSRFQAIFDHAPVGISFTAEGQVVMVNPEHARITGVAIADSNIPGIFGRVSHPEDYARQKAAAQPFHEGRIGHYTVEKRYLHPDGRVVWAELSSRFLPGPIQGRNWIVTTVTDICGRKEAEAALRRSEERLTQAMDLARLANWEMDGATATFTFNDRFYALYGTTAAQEGGYRMTAEDYAREFLLPEDRHLVAAEAAKMLAGTVETDKVRHPIRRRDGEIREILVRVAVIRDSTGRVTGLSGSNQDITELRDQESRNREALQRLEKIASSVPGVVYQFRLEPDGRSCFPFASEAIREIYRVSPEEVQTDATKVFQVLHPEDYSGIVASIEESARKLTPWSHTYRVRFADGTVRWLSGNALPQREEGGAVLWHGFITDVTERRALETQLLQAQRMEAIGALASGVAHDLNNILSPIVMVTDLLEGRLSDEGDRQLLALSHANALRGAEIIRQLLNYSRGQAAERRLLQPRHLIGDTIHLMRETFPREIELRADVAADLWPVEADPTQLHQALMNLCVNARDAMPGGGRLVVQGANLRLAAGQPPLAPHAQPGPFVVITVSDTGHGIPREVRHRVFDPFFTTKPVGKGTGLGLASVLGIVRSHGGFADFDSDPAHGTAFRIYLPARPDESPAAAAPPRPPPVPPGQGQTILAVDDEPAIREGLRFVLEPAGFEVLLAGDGREALALFLANSDRVSLVLTDLMMPVMNGVSLVRALRERGVRLPVLAMTGLAETTAAEELSALGVPEVVAKPFTPASLLAAIHRRLTLSRPAHSEP